MELMRVNKALIGLAVLLAATLSQAQSSGAAGAPPSVNLSSTETGMGSGVYRGALAAEHGINSRLGRIQAALTTPAVYPAVQAGTAPTAVRGGGLKGWVLLLMGAFLIITISQRRYQALSDH